LISLQAADSPASGYIEHPDGVIPINGRENSIGLVVHTHMVESAPDIGNWNNPYKG
jgi:hypothetical protein